MPARRRARAQRSCSCTALSATERPPGTPSYGACETTSRWWPWDAPGAGGSSDPPESLGLSGYAGALAVFLTRLGLTRPHLMGLSFGAILALEFCTRHPERVQTLSLVSAYAGWRGSLGEDLANTRLVQAMQLSELPAAEFVDSLLPTMFRSGTPQPVVQHFADSMRSFHPVGFRAMARASAGDLREVLPQVRVPTLVIAGTDDARAPLKVAMVIHAAIAGSRLVVIPTPATCATRTGGSVQRDRARVPVRAHPLTWALPPSRTEVSTVDRPSWT
ncbi:MAG: alpha/beta fold hydrolase [Geodermatophilaceae bacterium]